MALKRSFSYTNFFYESTLYFALLVALTAFLGSLYFSEIRHYLPCNLCWYQRICMYPLVAVIAVGLLRQDNNVPYYVLPLSLVGQGIATYHYLLEKTEIFATPTSCQEGIPCTTPWINWGGFVTIPFLAMSAFFLITIFCLIAMTLGEPDPLEFTPTPWLQVAMVMVIVIVAFVLIYLFDPLRTNTLTLTIPATGEMSPVNATAAPTVQLSLAVTETSPLQETSSVTENEAGPQIAALGQELYTTNCAVCHGTDAQGMPNLGTSLVESPIIQEQGESDALAFIRTGRLVDDPANTTGLVMPPSGAHPELTDEEILAIIAYLHAQ